MTDGEGQKTSAWDVMSDSNVPESDLIVKAPVALLSLSFGFALFSALAWSLEMYWVGYAFGVLGSGACIFTAALDQRRRANANYSQFGWFSPSIRAVRWFSTLVTLIHIVYLARNAGK